MPDVRTIFADNILDASVTHGVARFTMGQAGPEGKPVAAGQLVMPLSQLPAFTNGLIGLLKRIDAKVKEAQQGSGDAPASAAEAGSADTPPETGAFRFS